MGLWDKVEAYKAGKDAPEEKPKIISRSRGKVKWGSDAIANFKEQSSKKKEMAKRLRKDQDTVLGDKKYKYIRKNGKAIGFTQGDKD